MRSIASLAVLLCLLMLVMLPPPAPACDDIDPIQVLPQDSECETWVRDGEPYGAYTVEELTIYINGQAFFYAQYGFVAAGFCNYLGSVAGGDVTGSVSLYNQGTEANAVNLFNDPEGGYGDPVPDWSGSGLARWRTGFGATLLEFQEACFYGQVLVLTDADEARDTVLCLALAAVARIQGAVPVERVTWGTIKATYR